MIKNDLKRKGKEIKSGYTSFVSSVPMLVTLTIKCIPDKVLEKNRKQAEGMWKDGKPKKWYYAIPIIVIWILIIVLIIKTNR